MSSALLRIRSRCNDGTGPEPDDAGVRMKVWRRSVAVCRNCYSRLLHPGPPNNSESRALEERGGERAR